MLIQSRDLWDFKVTAVDGNIGRIHDLQADDRGWCVCDIVLRVGHWLTGELVIIPPSTVVGTDLGRRIIEVALWGDQVVTAPRVETHPSVSRQRRVAPYHYLGLPLGVGGFDPPIPAGSCDARRPGADSSICTSAA